MLPLIPLAAIVSAALAGGAGIAKGVDAHGKHKKAQNIMREAEAMIESAQNSLRESVNRSDEALSNLGSRKLKVLDGSMDRFIFVFEMIHNIELKDSSGLDELRKYRIDKQEVHELKSMSLLATEILGGLVGGAGAGALTAFGAYSATMAFASASTGTAIATLSGIAAQNAALAFLGGGALVAGGGGMALGGAVLGGLVAGPALLVLGFVADNAAQENLEKALSNKEQAKVFVEELRTTETLCNGISKRATMFHDLLDKLDTIFVRKIHDLQLIIKSVGTDYAQYNEYTQNQVAMCLSIAGAIKTVLDTPILHEDGSLTTESVNTYNELSRFCETLENAEG